MARGSASEGVSAGRGRIAVIRRIPEYVWWLLAAILLLAGLWLSRDGWNDLMKQYDCMSRYTDRANLEACLSDAPDAR